jgi:hypothetical protein
VPRPDHIALSALFPAPAAPRRAKTHLRGRRA